VHMTHLQAPAAAAWLRPSLLLGLLLLSLPGC
jgi:hypothetical protein